MYSFPLAEPITTLVGAPDLYINTGSTVNLTCIVQHSPEPPPAIKWMHNNAVSTKEEEKVVHIMAPLFHTLWVNKSVFVNAIVEIPRLLVTLHNCARDNAIYIEFSIRTWFVSKTGP